MTLKEFWILQNNKHIEIVKDNLDAKLDNTSSQIVWFTKMTQFYSDLIIEAKQAYYNGNPIMDDIVYDKIEDCLRLIDPKNKALNIVGSI